MLRRAVLILAGIVVVLIAAGTIYLASLPSVDDAAARGRAIMAMHHETAGSMPTPANLADAVVATEDEHFDDNVVVNVLTGAGRAALATLQASQDPGGSTIDQQLAKQLYGRGHGLTGTLREIGLGLKLAVRYPKAQILALYLNVNYYGHGYWGVKQAARGYFGTTPAGLTWSEASMLAGLLQAPSAYDPIFHRALAKQRQRHVLDRLVENGKLTHAQADAAYAAVLPLRS